MWRKRKCILLGERSQYENLYILCDLLEKANYGDNKKFSACQWIRGGGMSRWMEDV